MGYDDKLSGAAIRRMMRRHGKTIRGLAQQYDLTMERVRYVRANGVKGQAFVRDWAEMCTATNPKAQA